MDLSELRRLLMHQHSELRVLAASVRASVDPGAPPAKLRQALLRLHHALAAHNAFEEKELHSILPTIDAWGKVRHDDMLAGHAAEHATMLAAVATADSSEAALAAVATLIGHMEAEERDFLGPDVLRDDLVTSGLGG